MASFTVVGTLSCEVSVHSLCPLFSWHLRIFIISLHVLFIHEGYKHMIDCVPLSNSGQAIRSKEQGHLGDVVKYFSKI